MSGQGSGRIIGAVVGAVAAYFTGGLSVVLTGAALGAAVGGAFDKGPNTQGPRLDDLKVQTSSYGVGIPTLYGTERFSGNVIWSTDKLEVANTTSAGKGGGASNTNYRYYVHMRIMLCETPRDGSTVSVLKIFQDGKLIWDATTGIPLSQALASADNRYASFTLYQGRGDQLPEPGEESWEGGPGSVSAYRDVVSVRMNAVECVGGREPQFSFVLTTTAASTAKTLYTTLATASGFATAEAVWLWKTDNITVPTQPTMAISRAGPGETPTSIRNLSLGQYLVTFQPPYAVVGAPSPMALMAWGVRKPDADYNTIRTIDLMTGTVTEIYSRVYDAASTFIGAGTNCHAAYDTVSNKYAITRGTSGADTGLTILPGALECDITYIDRTTPIAFYNGFVYALNYASNVMSIIMINANDGTSSVQLAGLSVVGASLTDCSIQVDSTGIYVRVQVASSANRNYKVAIAGVTSVWTAFAGDSIFIDSASPLSAPDSACLFLPTCAIVGPSTLGGWTYVQYASYTPGLIKPKDIIADQCQRAGVAYDVSALPDADTLNGYKLAGPASARANIDPLLTCFGYFVVDEDGVTKFKRYADIVSVTNVSFDELGQVEAGNDPSDAMPLNRTQEVDLARSVTVSYIDASNDYQVASETEVRQVTTAIEDQTIQLPLCIISDQAQKAAQMALYDQAKGQNTRSLTVSRKFAFVSPGDGATIEYPRGTFRLWMVMSVNDTGAVCEWVVRPGDAAIYTQTAIGAKGYVSQAVDPLPASTRAQILNIPPLRDVDNNAGPYVALDSFAAVPANAELLVGPNDVNLTSRGSVSASAPIGFGETVLASASNGFVDETNLLTVNLGDDVFNSVTRDVLLSGGGEFWAYGADGRWEIGSSALASSLGSGRYILSRHLRGLFGTERFIGTQLVGDTFVLLRIAGMLRPDTGVGGIGQVLRYRPVTKGQNSDSAASQSYANTGEGLLPLSPVNARRTDTNDFTVDRRSRMSMNNASGDIPLGETSERYSWSFYTSSAFTNLIGTVITNVPIVTAAQQAAIGRTASAQAFLSVGQMSDSVGVGHQLQATI